MNNPYRELASNLRVYKSILNTRLEGRVDEFADNVVEDAKALLTANGNVYTGNLRDSIRYEKNTYAHGIKYDFIADAATVDGVKYAEFIEYGTGINNIHGDGRQTPWRYYNQRLGRYVTTRGSQPYPFLRPSITGNAVQHGLRQLITDTITEDMEKLFSKGHYIGP